MSDYYTFYILIEVNMKSTALLFSMTSAKQIWPMPKTFESKGNDDNKPSILTTFRTPITCTVGRKRSGAGYYVNDSDDIAELLATLTNSLGDGKGRVELLQFDTESSLGSSRSLDDLARQNSGANMA